MTEPAPRSMGDARPYILFGLVIVVLMFGGLGAWAAIAQLSGAVIAPGIVAGSSKRQTLQHLEGGIISELLVRDYDTVAAGQLLIRLDDTRARATLGIIDGRLDLLRAQASRLRAERDGLEDMVLPAALTERFAEPAVIEIVEGQIELFKARRVALHGETEILTQRISQLGDQTRGLEAQQTARERQSELISEELEGLEQLFRQGYAPRTRVLELQRSAERLRGEVGELIAEIARTGTRIGETRLQIIQLRRDSIEQSVEQLREARAQICDLEQRRAAALDELKRLDIFAPKAGAVVGLDVHTVGGVIAPGQPLLDIVPEEDELVIEAQIAPQDIDKIAGGLPAVVRLSAFNLRTTPELNGTVFTVSADRLIDPANGLPYYSVRGLAIGAVKQFQNSRQELAMPKECFGKSHVPLSPAVRAGDFVFTSGQVPVGPGGAVVQGGITEQTEQVLQNVKAALALAGCAMDDVVKTTVWLEDARDFGGFNTVYGKHFAQNPPARKTAESRLMIDIKVEIEAIAYNPR